MTASAIQQANLQLAARNAGAVMERVIVAGDLAQLSPEERVAYYLRVCESVGLNPLTRPFEYIKLNGKLTLYALKTTTDQLRQIHGVSIVRTEREASGDVLTVTAYARTVDGREDTDIGVVTIKGLCGENLANAHMKALTKAKRRVTLSICGLGWLDESEVDSVPSAQAVQVDMATGEMAPSAAQEPRGTPSQVQQEAKPAPTAAEEQARREDALRQWASRIGDMAARIRQRWPQADVGYLFDGNRDYRTDLTVAKQLYADLKELGETLAAPPETAPLSDSETVDAEFTPDLPPSGGALSEGQRKALCAHANRAGAKTSEDRAALWGWALSADGPVGTRTLTGEQAGRLLDWAGTLKDDQMVRALEAARGQA